MSKSTAVLCLNVGFGRGACVVAALLSLAAPSWAAEKAKKQGADLSRLVVIGDSLSAGFQNFSLFTSSDGGQTDGFAALIAQQGGVSLTLPTISYPGIPPALTLNAGQIVPSAGFGSRQNPGIQATNLSVPGFTLTDIFVHPFPGNPGTNAIDALSDSILGTPSGQTPGCGPIPTSLFGLPLPPSLPTISLSPFIVSEVACALALDPSTLIVSIGSNDVLQTLTLGQPPTDPGAFRSTYSLLIQILGASGANVVVSNIPDVTEAPFLVSSSAFLQLCGQPLPPSVQYVVPNLAATTFDICHNNIPVSQATVNLLRSYVTQYNQAISDAANQVGAVVVDINGLLSTIAANGYDVAGRHLTTNFLGGIFSLDGIHPTNSGYAIMANQYISAMNAGLGTKIHSVTIEPIVNHDPLVPKH
jgi:phospholipase/lecithinase/hemolysin